MGRPETLSEEALEDAMGELVGWNYRDGALHRVFQFPDFVEAFAFMTKVAMEAERCCHHPDWENVYSRLNVRLSTHDAGGVTSLDVAMAQAMDRFFKPYERD